MRIGLTPLVGLVPAKTFAGFETEDHGVKVLVTELPAGGLWRGRECLQVQPGRHGGHQARDHRDAGRRRLLHHGKRQGRRDQCAALSTILPGPTFSGYVAVQVPENAQKIYTDEAVRQMFASAAVRKEVPVDEQLGLLPFKITDLADFKNVRTLAPGAAIMLADAEETKQLELGPYMVIGLIGSTPAQPEDRGRFAQQAADLDPRRPRRAHDDVRADPHRGHGRL